MMVRKLDKSEWQQGFDALSHSLEGKQAEVEAASLKLGDQVDAEWLPLLGISYDPKDDVLDRPRRGSTTRSRTRARSNATRPSEI